MNPTDPALWAQYGPWGLIVSALIGVIIFLFKRDDTKTEAMMRDHRAERREWKQEMRADRKDSTDATHRLADALHSLETSLRSMK